MFNLSGKTALVTGASGGIGQAIAETLMKQGATVAIHGTRQEALDALKAKMGGGTAVVVGSLALPEQPAAIFAAAETALGGKVDILVNNAGITRDGLALRMKDEDWQDVINVNLTAAFKLSRAALKGMMARRTGRIINVSSIVGATGNGGQANYVASKAGLVGLTKSLAQEIASRGVTVNAVAPGFITTAMTDKLNDAQKEKLKATIPAGRFGLPEDIAAAVLYLASDEAAYVTGETLHVNGGMAML